MGVADPQRQGNVVRSLLVWGQTLVETSHPASSPSCVAQEEHRGLPWNATAWLPVGLGAGWILVSPMFSDVDSFTDERVIADSSPFVFTSPLVQNDKQVKHTTDVAILYRK